MINSLVDYIDTNYCLIIQYDGYIINPDLWTDEFLNYDYIGAPWWYESLNVGNGGFSLRSKRLLLSVKETISSYYVGALHPEDDIICRVLRPYLEDDYAIKFCNETLAKQFSFEPNRINSSFQNDTFGFHGVPSLIK